MALEHESSDQNVPTDHCREQLAACTLDVDSGCSFGDSNEDTESGKEKQQKKHRPASSANAILRIGIGQQQGEGGEPSNLVDRCLSSCFRRLGHWIARWRVALLWAMLLFSLLCSASISFTPQKDDLRSGYTPNGARSRRELAQFEGHFRRAGSNNGSGSGWQEASEPISLLVFVQARDNGTLLREPLLLEMVQLMDKLAMEFPLGRRPLAELCSDFCQLNEPIRQFTNGFLIRQRHLDLEEGQADRLNLSFPFMSILGHRIDLSPHLFGTELGEDGQLAVIRLALLQFRADPQENVSRAEVLEWERKIVHYLHREYNGTLRPLLFSMGFVADEVVRTGMTLFPFLSVGFAIMCAFSAVTVSASAFYFRQFSRQKILMALVACCCPLLACAAALGLLFWCGLRFGTILCVSPFLVLAIGVDDAFLMLQSWQRICAERRKHGQELGTRIGQMLEQVGPSITITSATNALAFCVGIFTPTPEIQLFCAGTATAIFFDYIYQLFLFVPCLAIAEGSEMAKSACSRGGKAEKSGGKAENGGGKAEKGGGKAGGKAGKDVANLAQQLRIALRQTLSAFMRAYCKWLASGFTSTLVLLSLLVYWLLSAKYALQVVPNITPRKLFLADSVLNEVISLKDTYILPSYMPVSIFIEKAGNLEEKRRIERIKTLVAEFEAEPNNLGPEFTHFWLRDFEQYMASELVEEEEMLEGKNGTGKGGIGTPFTRAQMAAFLAWPEYRHWNGFLRFREDSGQLDRFFVITAFHGPDMVEWNKRARLLARWRQIVDEYEELGAFVWVEEAQFLDQIETLVPATVQSSIATLLCMSLVCSLFMSNLFTVVVATLSIVSICLGAFGMMVAWGIDLDPISMATTIMSIGFSVDFPAHITYHYYCYGKSSEGKLMSPEERVRTALMAIGFPLLQCGFSTILFVCSLLFVETYMSEVFVKSIFLVVSIGLLHGLFVVPTMLCALSNMHSHMEMLFPGSQKRPIPGNARRRKNSIKSQKIQRTGSSKLVVSVAGPG